MIAATNRASPCSSACPGRASMCGHRAPSPAAPCRARRRPAPSAASPPSSHPHWRGAASGASARAMAAASDQCLVATTRARERPGPRGSCAGGGTGRRAAARRPSAPLGCEEGSMTWTLSEGAERLLRKFSQRLLSLPPPWPSATAPAGEEDLHHWRCDWSSSAVIFAVASAARRKQPGGRAARGAPQGPPSAMALVALAHVAPTAVAAPALCTGCSRRGGGACRPNGEGHKASAWSAKGGRRRPGHEARAGRKRCEGDRRGHAGRPGGVRRTRCGRAASRRRPASASRSGPP